MQELSHLNWPHFLGVTVLLIIHDAVLLDVGHDFLHFRQRSDLLVVIELLRGRVLLFLQEHQLRIEQEAALFRQVACRPLHGENVETPQQASPLAVSCEGDDGTQVFLSFSSNTRGTRWRLFDVRQGRNTCFAASLLPHRAPRKFVAPSTPSASTCLNALSTGGMSSMPDGPVPAAVR